MIMVAVYLPEMCRRHMISITPHKERSVGVKNTHPENQRLRETRPLSNWINN